MLKCRSHSIALIFYVNWYRMNIGSMFGYKDKDYTMNFAYYREQFLFLYLVSFIDRSSLLISSVQFGVVVLFGLFAAFFSAMTLARKTHEPSWNRGRLYIFLLLAFPCLLYFTFNLTAGLIQAISLINLQRCLISH